MNANTQTGTHKYPILSSEQEIRDKLHEIGVDVFEPLSKSEEFIAHLLEEFSNFCLETHSHQCQHILETCHDGSVGQLQGGNDKYSIYRVSFPECNDSTIVGRNRTITNNAAEALLHEFNVYYNSQYRNATILTLEHIQKYMLSMLARRSSQRNEPMCTQLGNIMFILQFGGPTSGQVRHIDNMVSNVQVCLYMSNKCPSTIVYVMDDCRTCIVQDPAGPEEQEYDEGEHENENHYENDDIHPTIETNHGFITNSTLLLQYWKHKYHKPVPKLVQDILKREGNMSLMSKWYTKYFGYWKSLNDHLYCFGKLYQDVKLELGLNATDPGTVLLAGGNEVHAGPPTYGSRMFAFAIGIPEENDKDGHHENDCDHENDGEVQYNPVLLHIDICTLIMDYNPMYYNNKEYNQTEAKRYLLDILFFFIQDYPMRAYLSQMDEKRVFLLSWMEQVLDCISSTSSTSSSNYEQMLLKCMDEAVNSDVIFYTPEIIQKKLKKRNKRQPIKRL